MAQLFANLSLPPPRTGLRCTLPSALPPSPSALQLKNNSDLIWPPSPLCPCCRCRRDVRRGEAVWHLIKRHMDGSEEEKCGTAQKKKRKAKASSANSCAGCITTPSSRHALWEPLEWWFYVQTHQLSVHFNTITSLWLQSRPWQHKQNVNKQKGPALLEETTIKSPPVWNNCRSRDMSNGLLQHICKTGRVKALLIQENTTQLCRHLELDYSKH